MTKLHSAADSKHKLIANALAADIARGRYPVGSLLPSEPELMVAFGVSRFTIRTSLRSLQSAGLVSSRKGVGSTVVAKRPAVTYTQAFDSVGDLLQYAAKTRVQFLGSEDVVVGRELSAWLNCREGEHWRRIVTVRSSFETDRPIAYSEIFLPSAVAAALPPALGSEPIFAAIEKRTGHSILEVRQDIAAAPMPAAAARELGVRPGTAGLLITRRYLGVGGQVLEVTKSLHPHDQFSYSMRVRR